MRSKVLMLILVIGVGFGILSSFNKEAHKQIGLQLYSVRQDMQKNLPATLDSVAAAGYTFVEASGYYDGKFYDFDPRIFAELLQKAGLRLLSSHVAFIPADTVSEAVIGQWWEKAIDAHQKAGAAYIVQSRIDAEACRSLEKLQHYCDYLNMAGEYCNKAGIRFGYHNHAQEFEMLDNHVIYDYMLTHTDPEKVFFQIDTYWASIAGVDPAAYLKTYPGRFELWHIRDEKELGASGNINFEEVYKQAGISGMRYAIVEQEAFTTTPFAGIRQSNAFIQNAPYIRKDYSK